MNTITNPADVRMYIESFSRPNGYSPYAWNVTKKIALEIWDCYLSGRSYSRPVNFMCDEFYQMIQKPGTGEMIIPRAGIKMYGAN
jgi:hypothetical protein